MAIELGSSLLGEFIIFTIGAGVLLLEYQRQSRKEAMKEEMVIQEKLELQATLNELAFQAERQDTQIRELTRILAEIGIYSFTLIKFPSLTSFSHSSRL
jgi:optic atrophy 3 protein